MKNRLLILLFPILLVVACTKFPKDQGIILFDLELDTCGKRILQFYDDSLRIIDSDSMLIVLDSIHGCNVSSNFTGVDFDNQMVLAVNCEYRNHNGSHMSQVLDDQENRKYVFNLYIRKGTCTMNKVAYYGYTVIVVPKPPSDYTIELNRID